MRARFFVSVSIAASLVLISFGSAGAQQGSTPTAQSLTTNAHALASSAKTLKEFTEALRVCGRAMKADPTPEQKQYINKLAGWTYNKRGEALVELGEDTAETDAQRAAEYEKAAVNDFELAIRFDQTNWRPRFNRAVSVAMQGDYETAVSDLTIVIRAQPKHKNALFNRAEILLQLGEYDRATADYAAVIKLDPNDGAAYAGRGIALSAMGDSENAMHDLNQVVRLDPESATAYVDRADLHAALGNWERAAGDYRVAIRIDNTMGRAYQNVAWLMATCPVERFRNPELAIRAAQRAIELEGQTPLGWDTYAAALASAGHFAKAAQAQEKAIRSAPEAEKADFQTRLALYQQQRPFVEQSADVRVQLATAEEEETSRQ